MNELRATRALISGGASGIGLAIAEALANQGVELVLVSRRLGLLEQEAARLQGRYGVRVLPLALDLCDGAQVRACHAEARERLGPIDLLINNAGQPSFKTPTAYEAADVDKCLKGLKGMILWTVETLKACGEQNVKIAQIMSTAATRGNANESVYCATKWGEKGYTKSLQAAYKGTSVKVVAVYPGGIDTAFYRDSRDYVSEAKQHTFMQPGPLAEVILFNLINEANLTVTDIEINRNS